MLGRKIGETQREYEALTTTRRRKLEIPLNKIEDLRTQRGLPVTTDEEAGSLIVNNDEEESEDTEE
jgi:hypothetical protein